MILLNFSHTGAACGKLRKVFTKTAIFCWIELYTLASFSSYFQNLAREDSLLLIELGSSNVRNKSGVPKGMFILDKLASSSNAYKRGFLDMYPYCKALLRASNPEDIEVNGWYNKLEKCIARLLFNKGLKNEIASYGLRYVSTFITGERLITVA
jgi:hypothetical protein